MIRLGEEGEFRPLVPEGCFGHGGKRAEVFLTYSAPIFLGMIEGIDRLFSSRNTAPPESISACISRTTRNPTMYDVQPGIARSVKRRIAVTTTTPAIVTAPSANEKTSTRVNTVSL